MKLLKKLMVVFVAALMVMSLTSKVNAEPATDGSITISNTTSGKTYTAYKVFSATYTDDNPQKVAYFYDGSNEDFLAALNAASSPFELTGPVDGLYNVVRKADVEDATIIDFIKNNAEKYGAGTTKDGNGSSITFSGLDYGYYYITTTSGTAVTIDSALKDVTVIDKNQGSTLDKQEQIATQGYYVDKDGTHTVENPIPTANVGDTVSYKVVGSFTQYQGTDKVTKFRFVDTMSAGLTADKNVVVKVKTTGDTALRELTVGTGFGLEFELAFGGRPRYHHVAVLVAITLREEDVIGIRGFLLGYGLRI